MIKSPLTSPLRPALTSPYELISRSVFELNGTQWGELSEPVVLDGDFEIELACYAVDSPNLNQTFLAGTDFRFQVVGATDKLILSYRDTSDARRDVVFDELEFNHRKINSITIIRVGDVYTTTLNSVSQPKTVTNIKSFAPDSIGVNTSGLGGSDELVGMILGFKVWTNGDRTTGDLILNEPFDESGSDYQRNRAVALGENISSVENELNCNSSTAYVTFNRDDPVEPGYYLATLTIHSVDFGGLKINLDVGAQDSVFFSSPATVEIGFHTDDSVFAAIQAGASGFGGVISFSLSKWSGVILKSALPEDWMQIEKKRWRDYWLEESLTVVNTSDNLDISKNVLKVGDNYTRDSITQSSYIGRTLISVANEGPLRLVRGQVRLSNLSESALYIPIRLQGAYPARIDASFNVDGGFQVDPVFISGTDIEIHKLSATHAGEDLVIDFLIETSSRLNFYISPRNEPTGDLDNSDPDATVSYDFKYISTIIRRKLEIAS